MDNSNVAALLNRLACQGLPLTDTDGLQAVQDYFVEKGNDDHSDTDSESEEEESPKTPQPVNVMRDDVEVPDVVCENFEPFQRSLFTELLNDNKTNIVGKFIENGCGCTKGPTGNSCLMHFNIADIVDYRLQCFELDYMSENENRLNFMIVSQLCALMHRDDKLTCSNRSFDGQKSRSKTMMDYRFRGYTVCMGAFLFVHGIGRKRLRLLRKRAIEQGIQPVRHGNAGRTPTHKVMTFEDVQRVADFLNNYAENNALILPGRVPSFRDQSLKLLPSWETKTAMHDLYAKSCPCDVKPVSRRSFVRIWKKTVPHIIIQMPRSDLCLTCQQNTTSMVALANISDEVKTDRIESSLEHLNLVQRERLHYTDTIQKCKDMLVSHPTKCLLGNQVRSFPGASHISFDFAQQVHIPNLPDQPGPIYFLTPYKIGLFGIHNEAIGIQVNYVITEGTVTRKGANSVVSMVHHYLSHYTLGESVLYIHADNCMGQNKNNIVMQYLCLRVLCGFNRVIKIMFLPVGHTKFAPDAGFGMIKSKFRRSQI